LKGEQNKLKAARFHLSMILDDDWPLFFPEQAQLLN
jgi:hypothetical protein